MSVQHETWESFWGPLFLVRFHEENEGRWSVREERARWIADLLALEAGHRVVDLGCGDGVLDTCLARLGASVLAVDRLSSVLHGASEEAGDADVTFRVADLRTLELPEGSFDAVLVLDVLGLMSREDDTRLVEGARRWLRPGGRILVDFPEEPEETAHEWERSFDDGLLRVVVAHDVRQRLQSITPTFHRPDGTVVDLVDPYDASRAPHAGILRYLYSEAELVALLEQAGFDVARVGGHARLGRVTLVGVTRPAVD